MLDIHIQIEGDKVVLSNLQTFSTRIPQAVNRALKESGVGIHSAAQYFLMGSGGTSKKIRKDYGSFTTPSGEKVTKTSYDGAGAYPVPKRTTNLLRMLGWLHPGVSKSGPAGTFTAGPNEVVIYDSALYANVIHEGLGSSAKFGPRRYLTDALEKFNSGDRIARIFESEIKKEINP